MNYLKHFFFSLCLISSFSLMAANAPVNQDDIPVNYRLMDESTFQKLVSGNSIVGVTGTSKSLYILHFGKDGTCDMWKKNKVYAGSWWTEKDELGRDFVRAIWPDYSNADPSAAWYYVDSKQADTLLVATKTDRSPVLVVPGRAFPSS